MSEENPSPVDVGTFCGDFGQRNGWISTGSRLPEIGQLFFGILCDAGMRYPSGGVHLFRRVELPEGEWSRWRWATVCLSDGGRPTGCPDWWTPATVSGMPEYGITLKGGE